MQPIRCRNEMNTLGSGGRRAFLSKPKNQTKTFQRPIAKRDDTPLDDWNEKDDNEDLLPSTKIYSCEKTLTWINLASVIVLAVAFAVYAGTMSTPSIAIAPTQKTAPAAKATIHEMPFNLVPNDGKPGRGDQMILSLTHYDFDFDRLLHYRVCCFSQGIFICHAHGINKDRVGMTAYLTHDATMVLNAHGAEMIGATCKLWWKLKKKDS